MAKGGDKRRAEANRQRLRLLALGIVGAHAAFVAVRLVARRRSARVWHAAAALLTAALSGGCWAALHALAQPSFGPAGELLSGGGDLTLAGITSYYHDVIYVSSFAALLASATDYAWLVLLVMPAYAAGLLWTSVIYPWLSAPRPAAAADNDDDPLARRRRERAERRATRSLRAR